MKTKFRSMALLMIFSALSFTSCDSGSSGHSGDHGEAISSAKAITAFSLAFPVGTGIFTGIINEANHTIEITVPFGTNDTAFVPTIIHTGSRISPASEVTQIFISPMTYTVTAADGSAQDYIVTVIDHLEGVTVSYYQGIIDWETLKNSGITFVYIRASNGPAKDTNFDANWAGAKAAGIFRAPYHQADMTEDPAVDAENFVSTFSGDYMSGDLPPMIDLIGTSSGDLSESEMLWWLETWVDTVNNATEMDPIIYTSMSYWINAMDNSAAFSDHILFIAHETNDSFPSIPDVWWGGDSSFWIFWAYNSSGTKPGITVGVELDRYQGSISQLQALTKP